MLKKNHRLTTKQFNEVMNKGRVVHSPFFLLRILDKQADTRIAAVAPVKIAKKAVVRNRSRRQIYSVVQPILPEMKKGLHVLIFIKVLSSKDSTVNQANPTELKAVFAKAGLLE